MSSLEPLAAYGLTCNVMQVISFASETAPVCKVIFETGTLDPSLVKRTAGLSEALTSLGDLLDSAPKPMNSDDQKLLDVAANETSLTQSEIAGIEDDSLRRFVEAVSQHKDKHR
ncbi:hypothetical protein B0T26DRAFT_750728 [Lasiosphaeria miniovina]|uniref:Uncharacterized protein n=1 Tax=Lasiosphaeria miniovina TaxID=1954250 RepID=A0AA40E489_9PEZI|nr:uncharacterized protein B0T26DRAFT_750728 [Lasiosphaeria miniovina]KAK0723456.1 hypothetical protein B0T26DRAFT_750728 [Lasiosphaeria miniovina]